MKIINATNEYAAEIVQLIQEMAIGFGTTSPIDQEYVKKYLQSETSNIFLYLLNSQVVAMASYSTRPCLFHRGPAWYIEEVIVKESERAKGIATYLIKEIIKKAKEKGCVELSIAVGAQNDKATRVYKNLGFEEGSLLLEQHFINIK